MNSNQNMKRIEFKYYLFREKYNLLTKLKNIIINHINTCLPLLYIIKIL
jgi:hypothetical protein